MTKPKQIIIVLILLLLVPLASADLYRPDLHTPSVPQAPGAYSTQVFTGTATYTYALEVPPGTNGLQPDLKLTYNHFSTLGELGYQAESNDGTWRIFLFGTELSPDVRFKRDLSDRSEPYGYIEHLFNESPTGISSNIPFYLEIEGPMTEEEVTNNLIDRL
jgi:hypothetical protein